jgi:ubiquitin-protein ligase
MFQLTCLNCSRQIDLAEFYKDQISVCPYCGISAFEDVYVLSQQSPNAQEVFSFTCPLCEQILITKAFNIGKARPCPACKGNIVIPSPNITDDKSKTSLEHPPITKQEPDENKHTPTSSETVSERIVISFNDNVPSVSQGVQDNNRQNNSERRPSVPPPIPRRVQVTPSGFEQSINKIEIPKPPLGKLPPRLRRLYTDAESVTSGLAKSAFIRVQKFEGLPPNLYFVEYYIRGIESIQGNNIIYRNNHVAEIRLTSEYPRQAPACRLLTPIFHPNFEPAHICIGDHWTAQERLIDLIIRIGEMIAYQSYNVKSPLDGEAAKWADLHQNILPIDRTDLILPE